MYIYKYLVVVVVTSAPSTACTGETSGFPQLNGFDPPGHGRRNARDHAQRTQAHSLDGRWTEGHRGIGKGEEQTKGGRDGVPKEWGKGGV